MSLLDDYHATLPNFTGAPKMPKQYAEARLVYLQSELQNISESDDNYEDRQTTLNREIAEVQQDLANGNVTEDAQEIAYFEEYNAGLTAFINSWSQQNQN